MRQMTKRNYENVTIRLVLEVGRKVNKIIPQNFFKPRVLLR